MPKFLEDKLKARYGEDSDVPYKIMNAKGYMHGNKETAKGRDAESKHEADMKKKKHKTRRNAQLAALKR
jgi:hypothetical protein